MKSFFYGVLVCLFLTQATAQNKTAIKQVSSGINFNCVLFTNGQLKCFGENGVGQLGIGDTRDRGISKSDMGAALPFLNFGANEPVTMISTGDNFGCLVFQSGKLKCWGNNGAGQLGLGDTTSRGTRASDMGANLPYVDLGVTQKIAGVSNGTAHACAWFEDGRVKCWGENGSGQLGFGDTVDRGATNAQMGANLPFVDLGLGEKAIDVKTGTAFSCALLQSGKVKCWGENANGQLGYGDANDRGAQPNQMGASLPFVSLGKGVAALSLSIGDSHVCALTSFATVKCWGNNASGQLGYEDTTSRGDNANEMGDALMNVDLGIEQVVVDVKTFNQSTCALFINSTIKCWGANLQGTLGLGDTQNRGDQASEMGESLPHIYLGKKKAVIGITTGLNHICATIGSADENGLKCWGSNTAGELGLGDAQARGDNEGEMGDFLSFVEL